MGDLVVPNDLDAWIAAVEVKDILLHRFQLEGRAGVPRGLAVTGAAADIDDVAGEGVVPCGAVGDFPGIYLGVLIVCDESLHTAVEVDHIGVADLLPAASPLGGRGGVPAADLIAGDSAPLGGGGAVKDEVFQLMRGGGNYFIHSVACLFSSTKVYRFLRQKKNQCKGVSLLFLPL